MLFFIISMDWYIYNNYIYYTWGMFDEGRVFSFDIMAFGVLNYNFNKIGQSVNSTDYIALFNTDVQCKNYQYVFNGYFDSGEMNLYTLRADLNNPGNLFEVIKLINFPYRSLPGLAQEQ